MKKNLLSTGCFQHVSQPRYQYVAPIFVLERQKVIDKNNISVLFCKQEKYVFKHFNKSNSRIVGLQTTLVKNLIKQNDFIHEITVNLLTQNNARKVMLSNYQSGNDAKKRDQLLNSKMDLNFQISQRNLNFIHRFSFLTLS